MQRSKPSLASASPGNVKPTRSRSKSTFPAAYFLGSNGFAATTGAASTGAATTGTAATSTGLTASGAVALIGSATLELSATAGAVTGATTGAVTGATAGAAATTGAPATTAPTTGATTAPTTGAAAITGAIVSKLIALVSGSNVPANSIASLFNVHAPLKPKITGSYTFTRSPATRVAITWVFSPNSGPSSNTMLAMRPTSIVPVTKLKPSCFAGRVVRHESNSSSDKPLSMARRARAGKSARLFNLTVLTLTSTPASISCFTLRGANAHVSKSRKETDSSFRGSLTSGVFGNSNVSTIGKCVAAISFSLRNSFPQPITRAFNPNSWAKPAARKTSCSLLQSKITVFLP